MEEKIRAATDAALIEMGAVGVQFAVEWPGDMKHGDFAVNAALAASKTLGKSPKEIAQSLAASLKDSLGDDISHVEVAGPGFVNITLLADAVTKELSRSVTLGSEWGRVLGEPAKTVMIEYSNPNPFKEIHIGHLMSNVIGEALSRILDASGAAVIRDTFGGDVGPHVAKALWALQKDGVTDIGNASDIGTAYTKGSNAYEENEEVKSEIDALNTKIYDVVAAQNNPETLSEEDRALLSLWRRGREVSMEEFARLFSILGTKFDYIFYDSDTTEGGMRVVRDGIKTGVFEESEGAVIYRGEKKGVNTLVFITSRGTPTYETKDIGLAFLKEERHATDEVIIITAAEQIGHFIVVLAALEEVAPVLAKKMTHVPHGFLRLTTGKMSSRKGNIITASELLGEITASAAQKNADPLVAQAVAIAAIKYMILRQAPGGDIIFDPEKSLALDGDSGPYLQYSLVRAKSLLAKSIEAAQENPAGNDAPEMPYELSRLVIRYPEIVKRAQALRAPHIVAQYLTQLAGSWNSFYAQEKIIGGEFETHKLSLVQAFATTMENGLDVLGIPVPERM
jgi:arginyl-tRNA synthetase